MARAISICRARETGGFVGGLFAVFVPPLEPDADRDEQMRKAAVRRAAAAAGRADAGAGVAFEMISLLFRIARQSDGGVRVCRDVD